MTVQELAKATRSHFMQMTRDSGELFYVRTDTAPDWVGTMVFDAHGDMPPDDTKYEMIVDALCALEEYDDADDARVSIEPPLYTAGLTAWLASSVMRPGYCDDAAAELGAAGTVLDAIRMGYLHEAVEVFDIVLAALEAQIDD